MRASVPKTFVKAFAATALFGEVVGECGVSQIDRAISACGHAEPRPCEAEARH